MATSYCKNVKADLDFPSIFLRNLSLLAIFMA